jgi:hypothetical protein
MLSLYSSFSFLRFIVTFLSFSYPQIRQPRSFITFFLHPNAFISVFVNAQPFTPLLSLLVFLQVSFNFCNRISNGLLDALCFLIFRSILLFVIHLFSNPLFQFFATLYSFLFHIIFLQLILSFCTSQNFLFLLFHLLMHSFTKLLA